MRCPYNCFWENNKKLLFKHFQETHPSQIIKNNSYSILNQSSPPNHPLFLLNDYEGDIFLSKYKAMDKDRIQFCTTCLSKENPVNYELIFYSKKIANPTLTRKLQTMQLGEMFRGDHVVLDFVHISEKLGHSEGVECRFVLLF